MAPVFASMETYCFALRVLGVSALTLALSGCDFVGTFAKEAVVSATSHRGWDTFTFKGQLPAEFGIDAIAWYGPDNPDSLGCQAPTIEPGKTVTRSYGKRYSAAIQGQPQDFSFEIPLNYYKGLCGMRLGRVKLEIKLRYGQEKWQKTYADGSLLFNKVTALDTAIFPPSGIYDLIAKCSFLFQESKLNFGIDKFMQCKSAQANFSRAGLADKVITLIIEVDPKEKPSVRNRWINTDAGWKPCQPTEKSNRCQNPPTFKSFQMNGQTCTVYPNCKEQ